MRRRLHTYVLPTSVLLLAALTGCGSHTTPRSDGSGSLPLVHDGDLTVCSDVPYPPFEDFDKSAPSGFEGFDIDVVTYVAQQLRLKLVVKDSDFDALQSGIALNAGQCDLAASAMTITAERAKRLGFSAGYYVSEQSLLVAKDSGISGITDLSGKKVGVQKGTTGESYAKEHAAGAAIVSFPSDAQMYAAIKAHQVDALLQDLPVNLDHERDPKEAGVFTIAQTFKTNEKYGFAMAKTNQVLITKVDQALAKLHTSGQYHEMYNTYFKLG